MTPQIMDAIEKSRDNAISTSRAKDLFYFVDVDGTVDNQVSGRNQQALDVFF